MMDKGLATSVAKNTAIQFGQQLVTWVSSFALMMFLPRYLGPVRYGRIYLCEMLMAMFIVVVQYDGRYSIARRISRDRDHAGSILVNSLAFRLVLWAVSFTGMMVFSHFAGYPAPVKVILVLFGFEMLWISARTLMSGVFLGFENTGYTAISAIAERAFVSVAGITALLLGGDEIVIAVVMITGSFIHFAMLGRYMKRFLPITFTIDWGSIKTLLREGFPYLLWTVFGIIYYRIDSVMLSLMTNETVVGWYGASYKFFDILAFLPSIFSLAILPVMSKLYGREGNMLAVTTQKSLNFILVVGIPVSIAVYYFSRDIIIFFFGFSGYGPSVSNLGLFGIGLPLLYIDMVLGTAIIACNKSKQLAWVALMGVAVNVGLNSVMIPYTQILTGNGGIGAAVATICTEFSVLVAHLWILPRDILEPKGSGVLIKSAAAGGVLIAFYAATAGMNIGGYWMVHAAVGALVYAGALLAMKTFNAAEIEFLKGFFSIRTLKEVVASRGMGRS